MSGEEAAFLVQIEKHLHSIANSLAFFSICIILYFIRFVSLQIINVWSVQ